MDETRFYTGVPDVADDPFWHPFWTNKLAHMVASGVAVYSRLSAYRQQGGQAADALSTPVLTGKRRASTYESPLDVIGLAWQHRYDVALIFSQDQDLSEVAQGIRAIAASQNRLAQNRQRLSGEPSRPQPQRHQLDRLDSHRSRHLRRLHRSQRLPAQAACTGSEPLIGHRKPLLPGMDERFQLEKG